MLRAPSAEPWRSQRQSRGAVRQWTRPGRYGLRCRAASRAREGDRKRQLPRAHLSRLAITCAEQPRRGICGDPTRGAPVVTKQGPQEWVVLFAARKLMPESATFLLTVISRARGTAIAAPA